MIEGSIIKINTIFEKKLRIGKRTVSLYVLTSKVKENAWKRELLIKYSAPKKIRNEHIIITIGTSLLFNKGRVSLGIVKRNQILQKLS